MDQFVGIPNVDKNIGLDVWKIPGTNGGQRYASDTRYGGALAAGSGLAGSAGASAGAAPPGSIRATT